ncbi:MAG: adenylyl-sulfate kinase [bacterium]
MAPTIWLTGLPASGKTTLATALVKSFRESGRHAVLLDGDDLRRGVCSDLGFSEADRDENVRRVVAIARLLARQGAIPVCALVSPMSGHRRHAREQLAPYFEVFVDCPANVCARRDPKGLWRAALDGEIPDFTGLGQRFELPESADYRYKSDQETVAEALQAVLQAMTKRGML